MRTAHVITATLAAAVLSLTACGPADDDDSATDVYPAPADTEGTTPQSTATSTPTGGSEQDTAYDIQTYESTWLVTTTEGAVTTVEDPSASEVPSTWTIASGGTDGMVQLVSSATTDDQEMCLTLPGADVVSVNPCDPADAGQWLRLGELDQPEQVNISNENGYLVSDPEGGVTVAADPSSPASVFTLVESAAADS